VPQNVRVIIYTTDKTGGLRHECDLNGFLINIFTDGYKVKLPRYTPWGSLEEEQV
jgi:hypothetical protein